jgi:hypothetical protein
MAGCESPSLYPKLRQGEVSYVPHHLRFIHSLLMALVRSRSHLAFEGNYLPHASLVGIDSQNCLDSLKTFGKAVGTLSRDEDNEVDFLFELWNPVRFRGLGGVPRVA